MGEGFRRGSDVIRTGRALDQKMAPSDLPSWWRVSSDSRVAAPLSQAKPFGKCSKTSEKSRAMPMRSVRAWAGDDHCPECLELRIGLVDHRHTHLLRVAEQQIGVVVAALLPAPEDLIER
jgi:hypothetical protein